MLIFGYPHLPSDTFRHIDSQLDIKISKNNEIVWFYSKDDKTLALLTHCVSNQIPCAVWVEDIVSFMLCAALKPKYLIIDSDYTIFQNLAENYMLDSKVLCVIEDKNQIATIAQLGIDGVIFKSSLIRL